LAAGCLAATGVAIFVPGFAFIDAPQNGHSVASSSITD
jgi:hypothetical protein